MNLVYLSDRRQRRLWPVTGAIVLVGAMVTLQVTVLAAKPAAPAIPGLAPVLPAPLQPTGRAAGHRVADARAVGLDLAAGIDGGD